MTNENTHFIFDGEKVVISPDLQPIVIFLQEIEKEVESFLSYDKKLESIRKQYLETFEFIQFLANKLKENSIDFEYTFSEHPEKIAGKLNLHRPIRSEMIVLFANLETLRCLYIAYNHKTSDKDAVRKLAMNSENIKLFLEEFCLNSDNEWVKKNQERASKITADDIKKLRNSLTHFFSVDKGLSVANAMIDEKSRKLESATQYKAKFLSPEDMYEMLKGAALLLIKKWNNDCVTSLNNGTNDFKDRILCVRDIVKNQGVIVVMNDQINI